MSDLDPYFDLILSDIIIDVIREAPHLRRLHYFAVGTCWHKDRAVFEAILKRRAELIVEGRKIGGPFANALFDQVELLLQTPGAQLPQPIQFGGSTRGTRDFYELHSGRDEHIKKFGITGHTVSIRLKSLQDAQCGPDELLERIFDDVLQRVGGGRGSKDMVGLAIDHPALETPLYIPFRRVGEVTGETIMHAIEKVQQSKRDFDMGSQVRSVLFLSFILL